MTEHKRTGVTARSGDTHVIDPSKDHAEAVNVDRAPPAAEAKPAKRREPAPQPETPGDLPNANPQAE